METKEIYQICQISTVTEDYCCMLYLIFNYGSAHNINARDKLPRYGVFYWFV